ncbi:MAG: efflux RND transporter periplasmic adaptor subunit [Lachnospiraceae bacterium]|nr:efflux RND transporter periplasmic adaptor subunit [Lachnospiraceae bacterium]
MVEVIQKNKKWIIVAAAVLIIAAVLIFRHAGSGSLNEGTAYVETVENLTGQNASLGMINRYSGVIEPQGTWSVTKNSDVDVEEIFVSEGDEVKEGDVLFVYDTTKYEEDLRQAEIDLERLSNEYDSTVEAIAQLEKEKREASSSEQANYTVQIKEQNLSLKDKELDIEMKEAEIDKLEDNIGNAEVKSGIDGVVKKINEGGSSSDSGDNSFITVMKVGNYRVKGTVNEQNIGDLYVDAPVIVHSRVNDNTWKGTITKIDTDNAVTSEGGNFMGMNSEGSKSTSYPFYVELENSEGLIMGQHVYVEPDLDQGEEGISEGIWLPSYMVDQTDPDHPFVWKDSHGKLVKQEVTISEVREELDKVKISEGLSPEDSICIPDPSLSVGMKTAPMSEKPAEEDGQSGDEEMNEGGEAAAPSQTEGTSSVMEGLPEAGEEPAGEESPVEGEEGVSEEAGDIPQEGGAGSGVLDVVGGQ